MRAGDVFATNIPYEGGTHTCDVCLVKPILVAGRVIAFAVSVTHWIEIGGAVPGSISPAATEIYQEGLQLPGVRRGRAGHAQPDADRRDRGQHPPSARRHRRRQRRPRGDGDRRGARARGVRALRRRSRARELRADPRPRRADRARRAARHPERHLPRDRRDRRRRRERRRRSRSRSPSRSTTTRLHADFTGCAPQTRGPVNCSTGALLSACKTVVRAITAPGARSNDGFFRPFSPTVPPGTVFSAEPPAPTGWYYEGAAFANDLIWKALAPVVPERLGAGSYTSLAAPTSSAATGRRVVRAGRAERRRLGRQRARRRRVAP